jgi:hypothetical protein
METYLVTMFLNITRGNKAVYFNPDILYCVKCDKVFKVFYVEEELDKLEITR